MFSAKIMYTPENPCFNYTSGIQGGPSYIGVLHRRVSTVGINGKIDSNFKIVHMTNTPHHEKTGLRGFRPGLTQTRLYSHRRWLEA